MVIACLSDLFEADKQQAIDRQQSTNYFTTSTASPSMSFCPPAIITS